VAESPLLDGLYDAFKLQGVVLATIYTQEAHPGEHYDQVSTMEGKIERAKQYRYLVNMRRPLFIDTLDQDLHSLCDNEPNGCAIITAEGILVLRSLWTTAAMLEQYVSHLVWAMGKRNDGHDIRYFRVERLEFGEFDADLYLSGLQRNGPRSVFDVATRIIQRGRKTRSP